ncbi:RagB/SusD family nutrient uptake outer membrane protein [Pedobacter sp. AW31-3R]|uniref:RagB/SusD family nutrient uptake outer membrane protein n=1 Tax=Pedobacter sp. AW31-3R TaxID=3445781 RepID=UPI003FA0450E
MSSIKLYISLLLLSCVFTTSCKKAFLDKQPDDMLDLDQVFKNRLETERYLRNVYSYLPDEIYPFSNYSGISDEGDIIFSAATSNQINTGNWSPISIPFDEFGGDYRGIRSASVFINKVSECRDCENYVPGSTAIWAAEARALRAWYYFSLLRKYGPVAIIREVLPVDIDASATQIPRNSYEECIDYIIAELDAAKAVLPQRITADQDYGKVDQRVVLAMKSRILLYAASPLWNGNTDFSNFRNADGKQLVNVTFDKEKWKKAADVAKELIDLLPAGLYKNSDNPADFDPFISYRDLFFERWNREVIWARPGNSSAQWEKHIGPRQVNGYNGGCVTQMQVDAYHMANGLRINDEGSGYVENGFSTADGKYSKNGDWNMYTNREPRFYATVLYNGGIWPYVGNGTIKIQMYATGLSGKNGSHDFSTTGYLIKKFSSPNTDLVNGRHIQMAYIYFRLGEIYLNYAEALNEYYDGGHPDIATYVNLIRQRGGIAPLPANLSQSDMRERIRRERRIELAFEGHRLFDTRRWKIAEQTDGGQMYGMNVSRGTSFTDTEFYQRSVFETRVFQRKHYLWPIPQSEMDRNKVMVQNPGW